jgi:predicted phosphohydrolase
MRLVILSDTHRCHAAIEVPAGDVLIHCGDFSGRGTPPEVIDFNGWLGTLPHARKIIVAGNHDFLFERDPAQARALLTNAEYLEDSGTTIGDLSVWGSPWQPWFHDWAFNLHRGAPIRAKWELIPAGTDVLITHGPPLEILDRTWRGEPVGCADLAEIVARIRPRLHLFGHIHEGYGDLVRDGVRYVNASNCDYRERPVNPAVVIDV